MTNESKVRIAELEKQTEEKRIKNTQYHAYSGNEQFHLEDTSLFSVLDFWRYQYSQLSGMAGEIAEFLVAQALGITKAENADYWTAYDMSYRNKRIEVKATQYVHPWNRHCVSNVRTFSIEPSNNSYWGNGHGKSRQNDVYVFCLDTNQDIEHDDPLDVGSWEFYVIPTFRIDRYASENGNPNQKTISLGAVRRLCKEPCGYLALKDAVDTAISESDQHHINEGKQ